MQKDLKTGQMFVAGRLLWLGLALSSCLLPQNDEPLPEIPPPANRPPRIVPQTVFPPLSFVHNTNPLCMPQEVKAFVDDEDTLDRIRIRWYVYDENGVLTGPQVQDPMSLPGGSSVRRQAIPVPRDVFTRTIISMTGTARRLQLIVADGEFTTTMSGALDTLPKLPEPLPDGGSIEDKTYLDTYTWVVDSVNASCQ